jgi:hypothetical protein
MHRPLQVTRLAELGSDPSPEIGHDFVLELAAVLPDESLPTLMFIGTSGLGTKLVGYNRQTRPHVLRNHSRVAEAGQNGRDVTHQDQKD